MSAAALNLTTSITAGLKKVPGKATISPTPHPLQGLLSGFQVDAESATSANAGTISSYQIESDCLATRDSQDEQAANGGSEEWEGRKDYSRCQPQS